VCDELKEILACYITGKESLSSNDREKVNNALRDWMDNGLDWLEENPELLENLWEVQDAIGELLCWKAAALMFNSSLSPFQDQLSRIGDLFTGVLTDRLVSANEECLSMDELYFRYDSFEENFYFINLVDELRNAGFLNEDPGIDLLNYCDDIATTFYLYPFLDTTLRSDIWIDEDYGYTYISLGEGDGAVAQSTSFTVYAFNLLGEPVELVLDEDYTIQNVSTLYHSLEGTSITEVLPTCYDVLPDGTTCCPHQCYLGGYCSFEIILNTSGDRLRVKAGRAGWTIPFPT